MISDDFRRMHSINNKAYLFLGKNGVLEVKREYLMAGASAPEAGYGRIIKRDLTTLSVLQRFFSPQTKAHQTTLTKDKKAPLQLTPLEDLATAVFADLKKVSLYRKNHFVIVYLPSKYEVMYKLDIKWRDYVKQEAEKNNYHLIDLRNDFVKEMGDDVEDYYIQKREIANPYSEGHYNAKGNALAAKLILKKLKENISFEAVFAKRSR